MQSVTRCCCDLFNASIPCVQNALLVLPECHRHHLGPRRPPCRRQHHKRRNCHFLHIWGIGRGKRNKKEEDNEEIQEKVKKRKIDREQREQRRSLAEPRKTKKNPCEHLKRGNNSTWSEETDIWIGISWYQPPSFFECQGWRCCWKTPLISAQFNSRAES